MTRSIDARGLRCPWPVLRLAAAMREAGDVTILVDDPIAPGEISAMAQVHGWRIEQAGEGTLRVTKPTR